MVVERREVRNRKDEVEGEKLRESLSMVVRRFLRMRLIRSILKAKPENSKMKPKRKPERSPERKSRKESRKEIRQEIRRGKPVEDR